ncbi:MAG: hypothetical protein JW863_10395 [Chitinispirillaceae bacterium]|nr:hypothetical protein [Chitinispirillaceae bacterium]
MLFPKKILALCIVLFSFSAFSSNVTMLSRNPFLLPVLSPFKSYDIPPLAPAKKLAATKDTQMIARIDYSSWENDCWVPTQYTLVSYNESGIATMVNTFSMNDSLESQTITTLLPDGKTVRTMSINTIYSLVYGTDTMISFATYYPSCNPVILISDLVEYTGVLLTSFSTEYNMLSNLDSIITTMLIPDSGTGDYDTMTVSRARYSKTSQNTFSVSMFLNMNYLTTSKIEYQLDYAFSSTPASDTATIKMTIVNADPPELGEEMRFMNNMMLVQNKDQAGRVTEALMLPDTSETLTGAGADRYLGSYSQNGTLEFLISQKRDTITGEWINTQKESYTYSSISLGTRPRSGQSPRHASVTARLKNKILYLTIAQDVRIDNIGVFNLQGRCIKQFNGSALAKGSTIAYPFEEVHRGMTLFHISTNKGDYTFRSADIN